MHQDAHSALSAGPQGSCIRADDHLNLIKNICIRIRGSERDLDGGDSEIPSSLGLVGHIFKSMFPFALCTSVCKN